MYENEAPLSAPPLDGNVYRRAPSSPLPCGNSGIRIYFSAVASTEFCPRRGIRPYIVILVVLYGALGAIAAILVIMRKKI